MVVTVALALAMTVAVSVRDCCEDVKLLADGTPWGGYERVP